MENRCTGRVLRNGEIVAAKGTVGDQVECVDIISAIPPQHIKAQIAVSIVHFSLEEPKVSSKVPSLIVGAITQTSRKFLPINLDRNLLDVVVDEIKGVATDIVDLVSINLKDVNHSR